MNRPNILQPWTGGSDSGGEDEEEVQIQPDADRLDFLKKHTVRANKDELLKQAGTVFAPRGRSTRQSKRLKQQAPSVSALLTDTSRPPQPQPQQQQKPTFRAELPPPPCRELEPPPAQHAVLAQEAQEIQHLLELVMEPHPSGGGAHAADPPPQESPPHLHPISPKTRQPSWEDPYLQWQQQHQSLMPLPSTMGHHSTPTVSAAPLQQQQQQQQQNLHQPAPLTLDYHHHQQQQQQQQHHHHHSLQQILGGMNNPVGSRTNVHARSGSKSDQPASDSPPWMAYVQKGQNLNSRMQHQQSHRGTVTGNAAAPAAAPAAAAARALQPTPARAPSSSQQELVTHPGNASQGLPQGGGVGPHAGIGATTRGATQATEEQVGGPSAAVRARDRKAAKLQKGSVLYQLADKGGQGSTKKEGKGGVPKAGTPASTKGGVAALLGVGPGSQGQQQKQKRGRVAELYVQTPGHHQRQRQQAEIVVPVGASPLDVLLPASKPCRSPTRGPWASTPLQPAPPQQMTNSGAGPSAASKGRGVLSSLGIGASTPTPAPPPSTKHKGNHSLAAILLASSDEDEPGQANHTPQQQPHHRGTPAISHQNISHITEEHHPHHRGPPAAPTTAGAHTHPQCPLASHAQHPSTPTVTPAMQSHPHSSDTAGHRNAAQPPTTPIPSHTTPAQATTNATPGAATTPPPSYAPKFPHGVSNMEKIPTSVGQHRPGSHTRPPKPPNAIHASANATHANAGPARGWVAGPSAGPRAGMGVGGEGGGGEGAGVLQVMEAQRAQQRAVLSILPPAEPSPISRLVGSAGSLGSGSRVHSQGVPGGLWGEEALPSANTAGTAGTAGGMGNSAAGGIGATGRRGGRGGAKSRGLTGRLKQLQGVVGARQSELLREWRDGEAAAAGTAATQQPLAPQPQRPTLHMTVLSSSVEAHMAKCVCACEGMSGPVHVMVSNNKGDHGLDPTIPGCRFVVHTPWHEFRMPPHHQHTLFGGNTSSGMLGRSGTHGGTMSDGTHGQGMQAGSGANHGHGVAESGNSTAVPGCADAMEGTLVVIALCCTPAERQEYGT